MTRTYELVYVLSRTRPTAGRRLHTQVEQIVERMGGTIDKTETAGRGAAASWPTKSAITRKASTSSK